MYSWDGDSIINKLDTATRDIHRFDTRDIHGTEEFDKRERKRKAMILTDDNGNINKR